MSHEIIFPSPGAPIITGGPIDIFRSGAGIVLPPSGSRIILVDGSQVPHDVSTYYDFQKNPWTYTETYDSQRGRTKTATLNLYGVDTAFVVPAEDNIVKIYRDRAGTDLVFGGVIVQIDRTIVGYDGVNWQVNYAIQCAGFDPQTLNYREVVNYFQTDVRSGQVLVDLLSKYAPWIDTNHIEIAASPLITEIKLTRKQLGTVVQQIVQATDWVFYVDDIGAAYFNDSANLPLNWGLTEGTVADRFPEFDDDTLKVGPNVQEVANDITVIGGPAKGPKYVETFTFNGHTGSIGLSDIPYGLDKVIQFLDNMDQAAIDTAKWFISDPAAKLSESLGRLQVNNGISNIAAIVTNSLFSRTDNVEFRIAELEIYSFASGKVTVGFHSGAQDNLVGDFVHAIEFDQSVPNLIYREGATTTAPTMPIGAGIYSVRIRIKSTGGAIYFIQGGRTATPREYGELGSKSWTKVAETSADTTSFMAAAMRFDQAIGCTAIRTKVSTDLNVTVKAIAGSRLGSTGSSFGVDTNIVCGVQGALDFETDCYIDVANSNPTLNFFTDGLPLGNIQISYWGVDNNLRERVYSAASKTSIIARSALANDDGSRTTTAQKITDITSSQDARDQIVSWLAQLSQYRGSFTTNSWRLLRLGTPGEKPRAGKLMNVTLPATLGFTFSEVITSVTGTDLGTDDCSYQVQFGEGNVSFDRLLRKIKDKALITIIDDNLAAVDADAEEVTTASTPRVDAPGFVSAVFDGTGVTINWTGVAGGHSFEVRDNLYRGQGQGGSFVYQKSVGTTYTISASNIRTIHKKRSFTFYIWSITLGGQYSKYPLVITVDNPAPVPQPISDIVNPDGLAINVALNPEVEFDILSSTGRRIQVDNVDATMTHVIVDATFSKTDTGYSFTGVPETTYFIRYGLQDDYTVALGDIQWSGIRTVQAGVADFSGTAQYLNNVPPTNAPSSVSMLNTFGGSTGYGPLIRCVISWAYSQAANVATNFGIIIKSQGGTPTFSDQYFMVDANKTSFEIFLPVMSLVSIGVFACATTKGGVTRNASIATLVNVSSLAGGQNIISVSGSIILTPASGAIVMAASSELQPVGANCNLGDIANKFLGVYSAGFYRNGTEIASLFALLSGNTYSGLHNFSSAQIAPQVWGSLAAFKSGISAGCFGFYADSGVMHVGYFDGGTYFGVAMGVV